jgi:uncharacterized protein YndB with AHSA1/START domain
MKLHNATTDRIEKAITLRAPRSRVWRALANAQEFGAWFGVKFEGAFKPGRRIEGRITSPGYEHVKLDVFVERVDPEACSPTVGIHMRPIQGRLLERADYPG